MFWNLCTQLDLHCPTILGLQYLGPDKYGVKTYKHFCQYLMIPLIKLHLLEFINSRLHSDNTH